MASCLLTSFQQGNLSNCAHSEVVLSTDRPMSLRGPTSRHWFAILAIRQLYGYSLLSALLFLIQFNACLFV